MDEISLDTQIKDAIKTTKKYLDKLKDKEINNVRDFLLYLPRGYEDLSEIKHIGDLVPDEKNIVRATIKKIRPQRTKNGKFIQIITIGDSSGDVDCVYFRPVYSTVVGGSYFFTGVCKKGMGGRYMLQNPTLDPVDQDRGVGGFAPVYTESPPLTSRWIRAKMSPVLELALQIEDIIPEEFRKIEDLMSYGEAVYHMHRPDDAEKFEQAKKSIAFVDMYQMQINALKRKIIYIEDDIDFDKKIAIKMNPDKIKMFLDKLPFMLTDDQKIALFEILKDCEKNESMNRLLQGDVGSGKTIVSLLAMLNIIID